LKEPQPASFSFNSPLGACEQCNGAGIANDQECALCEGSGLNRDARSFKFQGQDIYQLGEMEIKDLLHLFQNLQLNADEMKILEPILPQIQQRLASFVKLNLGYISLNRKIHTISGGELQRTRLVSQIGFSLSGIIYILDEPSIGMHVSEQLSLIDILHQLKEKDNTVIVVEHDENTINASDYVVDLGPGSGEHGGEVIYSGYYKQFHKAQNSLTADYLFRRKAIRANNGGNGKALTEGTFIEVDGISINNIKNLDLKIPLNALTVVTGVSGSGKSSLVIDAFYPIVYNRLTGRETPISCNQYSTIAGLESVDRILMVNQSSIGKNSRSCPATYINLMPLIRQMMAGLDDARLRGYDQSRFSFNVKGGRCEACRGFGYKTLEMSFLPQLEVECPVCEGRRYNSETLLVKYKGLSIADILDLTATEAYQVFASIPWLAKKIKLLIDVGLGYLKLGQSSVTLSGGESQRIKLCKELSRFSRKSSIYLLDEPTVGLHFDDIQKLLDVFSFFVNKGDTIVVIEHNLDIIKAADHIIDLGPGGGKNGGKIMYQGTVDGIIKCRKSTTGVHLKGKLDHGV
jgi:excinuclease ABC subunit A